MSSHCSQYSIFLSQCSILLSQYSHNTRIVLSRCCAASVKKMVLTADFDEIDPAEDQQTMAELSNNTRHLKLELIILARGNIVFLRPHYGVRALEGAPGNEPEAEPSESTGRHNTTFSAKRLVSVARLLVVVSSRYSIVHSRCLLCLRWVSAHYLLPLAPAACCAVAHACS